MSKEINCKICGEKVKCEEHGSKHVKIVLDSFDQPVYFCEKCVIEYHTAFGAIVHWHNPFVEHADEFDEAVKEFLNEQKQQTLNEFLDEQQKHESN
jgi:hypothetical protein